MAEASRREDTPGVSSLLESLLPVAPEARVRAVALAKEAPVPAQVGHVRFGSAGWTDPTLLACGDFYPRSLRDAASRLAFYASQFPLVEVDATYYAILSTETIAAWVARSPAGFAFDVKAHPILTGQGVDVDRLPQDLRAELAPLATKGRVADGRIPPTLRQELEARFLRSLVPLTEAGRLGCLLLQFPPWFEATRGRSRELQRLAERLKPLPLAVEFRHASWLDVSRRARVMDLLRGLGASFVAVDEPAGTLGGVFAVAEVTQEALAVVRLHGRNVAGWRGGASVHQRFDYLYAPEELAAWVGPVRSMAAKAREVHVVFNNCVRDHAQLGARGLAALLRSAAEADQPAPSL